MLNPRNSTQSTDLNTSGGYLRYGYLLWLFLIFFSLNILLFLAEQPINGFIDSLVSLRSEYTVREQLSKFYLFLIILTSIYAYTFYDSEDRAKASISFLILGLVFYLGESNMIKDIAQPIFGSVILLVLSIYLLRLRAWLTSVLLVLGFFVIFLAVLDDQAAEKEIISTHLPALLLNVLNHISEEQFDLWGISLIFLSSLVFFRAPLLDLFKRGAVCVVSLCFFSLALTVGNGLMHHQYNPSNKLHFVACLISLTGLSGLVFLNKSGKAKDAIFRLVTEDIFYIFVGLFFILIPSIHGRVRASVAILIWIPITIVMARYLWKYHRANHTKTTRSASDAYG